MLQHKIVDAAVVEERVEQLPVSAEHKKRLVDWIRARRVS